MIPITHLPTTKETILALHEYAMGLKGGNVIDVESLGSLPTNSLGRALFDHYLLYPEIPRPNDRNGFPSRYILVHDLHHVLLGSNADDEGEAEVMAFECGMLAGQQSELCLLPFISQLLESLSHVKNLNFVKIARFFDVGLRVEGNLWESWEFQSDLRSSVAEVKDKYHIKVGNGSDPTK